MSAKQKMCAVMYLPTLLNKGSCIWLYFAFSKSNLLSYSAAAFPVLKYYLLNQSPLDCPLTVLKCKLSVLEKCPSYRELSYRKMTEKWQAPTSGVRLIVVSVKRELTVVDNLLHLFIIFLFSNQGSLTKEATRYMACNRHHVKSTEVT